MKKIKIGIKEYIKKYYGELSRPSYEGLRRKCKAGEIPNTIKEGKNWYFIVDEETTPHKSNKS
ncbi:MAG: hypothetical protein RIT27_94 [Pseudomonadota bacterium]|jgi:hypothetical protein